jgi:pyruvate kinase
MCSAIYSPPPADAFDDLIDELESLRRDIKAQVSKTRDRVPELALERMESAENLLHYLAFRSRDVRPLQDRLARFGMSSLGRAEPNVMATLESVINNLRLISGKKQPGDDFKPLCAAFDSGADRLEKNTIRLFGEHPQKRRAHIIVTMPAAAADDYLMVHQLLKSGMNCMRINCAHDDPETWSKMIQTLRAAEHATGLSCQVLMDLGGPKLRLGPMETGPAVIKIRPVRKSNGKIRRPARIWLSPAESAFTEVPAADASIVVDAGWLARLAPGDRISLKDARGSRRKWKVAKVSAKGCWVETKKTTYVCNGIALTLIKSGDSKGLATRISSLAEQDTVCRVRRGDIIFVSNTDQPGTAAIHGAQGELLNPGNVSLAIPEVYRDVLLGDPIFFDDGRIGGIIEKQSDDQLQVRITHTIKPCENLEGGRGVNLPDSNLKLAALSEKDLRDIDFAARNANMIGLSFANEAGDVRALYQQLKTHGRLDVGAILKIETKRGFANLPAMLFEALRFPACGIMIARGDLAVECGFERMSEIQEEILWVSEAAHVPVIWATQVLEGLTKRGQVTRAEVTDAAMSQAAEAVMLNKGSNIVQAVEMLDDILQRMQGHHRKKRSMLRRLELAAAFNGLVDEPL